MLFKKNLIATKLDLIKKGKSIPTQIDVPDSIEGLKEINENTLNNVESSSLALSQLQVLDRIIQNEPNQIISSYVDFQNNIIKYPILEKIGESPENISYLENLVEKNLLVKEIKERLVVCPIHKTSFLTTVKLTCPKCSSPEIDKLNLFEHVKCGFITENKFFASIHNSNTICPSCKKEIKNFEKEIRIPALWYKCNHCDEKFDNTVLKMYCRSHDHEFDPINAELISVYDYKLIGNSSQDNSRSQNLKHMLESTIGIEKLKISSNVTIRGETGNVHNIPLSINFDDKLVLIFIIDDSKLSIEKYNQIIITVLDIHPYDSILVLGYDCDEKLRLMMKTYGINVTVCQNDNDIFDFLKPYLQKMVTKNDQTS